MGRACLRGTLVALRLLVAPPFLVKKIRSICAHDPELLFVTTLTLRCVMRYTVGT